MITEPVSKQIKVSKALLKDPEIKRILSDPVGVQLYLAIATTHIRSQYFNRAIIEVMRWIKKNPVKTASELSDALSNHGNGDYAVSNAWGIQLECEPELTKEDMKNTFQLRRLLEAMERNKEKQKERDSKLWDLVWAMQGIRPWTIEWI